jgi:hypothetical protein
MSFCGWRRRTRRLGRGLPHELLRRFRYRRRDLDMLFSTVAIKAPINTVIERPSKTSPAINIGDARWISIRSSARLSARRELAVSTLTILYSSLSYNRPGKDAVILNFRPIVAAIATKKRRNEPAQHKKAPPSQGTGRAQRAGFGGRCSARLSQCNTISASVATPQRAGPQARKKRPRR